MNSLNDKKSIEDIRKASVAGSSPESKGMITEYYNVANDLLNKYGPEGSYMISNMLHELIDEDTLLSIEESISENAPNYQNDL